MIPELISGVNGPCVTSGPNGPELNENVSENENGDSWSRDFLKCY